MNIPPDLLAQATQLKTFCFADCTNAAEGMLHAEIFDATIDLPVCGEHAAVMTKEKLLEYYLKEYN